MGCCGSSEATAPESEIPAPVWGQAITVVFKKKFMDADYNLYMPGGGPDGKDAKWMLLDAVGSFWDDGYTYFLKHRSPGQVDAEGKPTSTVLGAVNIKGECDAFSFQVSGGMSSFDFGPVFDFWDGDIDWGISQERSVWAAWSYSKRAIIYSDYEMTNQVGWLDITGSGTWHEWEEERVIHDTDDDGNTTIRREWEHHQDCRTHAFQYSLNVFNTPMIITYDKVYGGFWKASKLKYTAANAFAPDVPLFKVESDGERNATVHTFENSDPFSSLLAAYAISCKLDPSEFNSGAEKKCSQHIGLHMPPGASRFVGMPHDAFVEKFKYTAPPMPVFAEAVASFEVPMGTPIVFGTTIGSEVAQPMGVAQPVAVAQTVAVGDPQYAANFAPMGTPLPQ